MLRKLALSLAVAGVLGASQANALGLGEIQVNSSLNEPLDADIRLVEVRDLSPLQIQPRMADIDEFSLAGISKASFLTNVSFDVRVNPDGTGVIHMTSSSPIREPFLNFLVEVNWPSGRLVREYTLLLDPPVFDPAPTPSRIQSVQTTALPRPEPSIQDRGEPQLRPPAGADAASNIRTRMNPRSEVYVDVHDTLWKLATRHRPDGSVTGEQMMLALQRKNPASFPTGNINMLKAGTVMKLPSLDEVQQLTPAQAKAEVARQNRAWREGRTSSGAGNQVAAEPVQGSETAKDTPEPASSAPVEEKASSQLKVVAPTDGEGGQGDGSTESEQSSSESAEVTEAEGADAEGNAAITEEQTQALVTRNEELENRLLLTQESLARIERENTDLTTRMDAIASQIDKLERLVELKDRELALMQQQLEQTAVQNEQSEKGLGLSSYLLGGGAALIAFLLGLLLARRKRKEPDASANSAADEAAESGDAQDDRIPDMAVATAAAAAAGAAVASAADQEDEEAPGSVDEAAAPEGEPVEDSAAGELDDLDLDMDLDLDESTADLSTIDDEEFDLGADADLMLPTESEDAVTTDAETTEAEPLDTALDDILGGRETAQPSEPETPAEVAAEESDLLDELDFALDESLEPESEAAEDEVDELAGLDFAVAEESPVETPAEDTEEKEAFLDDFFNDEEITPADELGSLDEEAAVEPLSDEPLEMDIPEQGLELGAVEPTTEEDSFAPDPALEEMLQAVDAEVEQQDVEAPNGEADELDSLLASLDAEDEVETGTEPTPGQRVEEELTANIAHDLETDLNDEIDDLLGSTDDVIELEEESAEESSALEDDPLESLNLLEGADEVETKLDLARAYIEMEDSAGARDILKEILSEGNPTQAEEARKLLDTLD